MNDDLEIRSGGFVAVDTDDLRHAAGVWHRIASECDEAGERLRAAMRLAATSLLWADLPGERMDAAGRRAATIGADLRALATVYEITELEAARASAAAAGDARAAAIIERRLAAVRDADPVAAARGRDLRAAWEADRHAELERQLWQTALPLPGVAWGAIPVALMVLSEVRRLGLGRIPEHARLLGPDPPVVLHARGRGAVVAPTSLAELTRRVPQGDEQVRVERYGMPDGSRQYAVYIAGTKALRGGVAEPFDMASNARLYAGQRSDSYAAVAAALRRAGATGADRVHLVGHSQGAMIASRMALERRFRVATVVTAGSPVHADLGKDALQITLQHRDDPVAALAGGGHAHTTGAEGGFVAERVADPAARLADLALGAHSLDAYAETAALVDASDDPRVAGIRDVLAQLADAATVEQVTYTAVGLEAPAAQPAPTPQPAPQPTPQPAPQPIPQPATSPAPPSPAPPSAGPIR